MSRIFMNPDEPNFVWKNLNAVVDMECIIETELPDIMPNKRYETYTIQGRNGELTETFDDYEPFDFKVEDITIPHSKLREVKRWLSGRSQLITHNEPDKYLDAICSMSKEVSFENEWGYFYTFDVTFRCQPFKRKVGESPKVFNVSKIDLYDHGDEKTQPYFEIDSKGGNLSIKIGNRTLTILNTMVGTVTVDTELGKVMQEGMPLFTQGDWPLLLPGKNTIELSGKFDQIRFWNRSVYL
ncbi:phage tail protein [Enterococcus durans]|uniref:phage tail protein n=1 Tax=Enterococcus durans TaxID=53345 RepID=UPI003BEF3F72